MQGSERKEPKYKGSESKVYMQGSECKEPKYKGSESKV